MKVMLLGGTEPEQLGYVPAFLDENDPRPAREQFNERYKANGGSGWRPIDGFTNKSKEGLMFLKYPGDPALEPIAFLAFRDELIVFYPYDMIAIFQPGGDYEVARMN